jgi:cis-L-3-hydroxyproline dehydratase
MFHVCSVSVFDATVVRVDTNRDDLYGVGEQTPLGSFYLPAYPEGTREGIKILAPHLIGRNPTRIGELNDHMDRILKGHPYVKSALDMAFWDILGKLSGLPVCELLGGRYTHPDHEYGYPLYRAISQRNAEEMAENVGKYVDQGYTKIQLKIGGEVGEDIRRIRAVRTMLDSKACSKGLPPATYLLMCDANTGWLQHEAIRVVNAVSDLENTYIEQPCLTYRECAAVRSKCKLPFIIDEAMDDISMLVRIIAENAADCINLKISKVGGLTRARAIRDLAVSHGIPMNIEDTWGGDIVTAAISHLAHSTRPDCLLCSTDFNSYGPVEIARTTARNQGGRLAAPITPGLGVDVLWDVFGAPVFECV